jgi:hypothetical protein
MCTVLARHNTGFFYLFIQRWEVWYAPEPADIIWENLSNRYLGARLITALRIRDDYSGSLIRILSIPDAVSEVKKIPDPHERI